MENITARSTKAEIVDAAMVFIGETDEMIAELRRQRVALLAVIAVLAAALTF